MARDNDPLEQMQEYGGFKFNRQAAEPSDKRGDILQVHKPNPETKVLVHGRNGQITETTTGALAKGFVVGGELLNPQSKRPVRQTLTPVVAAARPQPAPEPPAPVAAVPPVFYVTFEKHDGDVTEAPFHDAVANGGFLSLVQHVGGNQLTRYRPGASDNALVVQVPARDGQPAMLYKCRSAGVNISLPNFSLEMVILIIDDETPA